MISNSLHREIGLLFDKAAAIQSKVIFLWALISKGETVIADGRNFYGQGLSELSEGLGQNSGEINGLFISLEPFSGGFDGLELIDLIVKHRISTVYIAAEVEESLLCKDWRLWKLKGAVEFVYLPSNIRVRSYIKVIKKIVYKNKPWVTAITATDINGYSYKMEKLSDEFGFLSHLKNIMRGANEILCTPSEKAMLVQMRCQLGDQDMAPVKYLESQSEIEACLSLCIKNQIYSVVLLAPPEIVNEMMDGESIDEVIYHWVLSCGDNLCIGDNYTAFNPTVRDWDMVSSTPFAKFNRMTVVKPDQLLEP